MKKLLLSFGVIGTFILYSLHQQDEASRIHIVPPSQSSSSSLGPTDTSGSSSGSSSSGSISPISPIAYKSGTYIGDVADAFYGPYQVAAVISGGKIANINFLQYPSDRRTSIEINTQAMPYLKQEAIQSQNAQVDVVSGATQSSLAFRQSLQSALDKAH